ncbi:MAG: ABC transporter substrate-binding protein [Actinomycetota bacterium]|nr:ABC transporter substrate-binding protein [Actinomycetota bacterium]
MRGTLAPSHDEIPPRIETPERPALRGLVLGAVAAALAAGVLLGGCGGSSPGRATLVLDFTPNAVHAGIFSAVAHRYDRAEGVRLDVRAPSASADGAKLLAAGRADVAVLDIHDLALARERGLDIVGVYALVQRPLAAVIAGPDVRSPRDLEARRVGVTGVPSDEAVLRSILTGAHARAARVRRVTIGFDAVPNLLAGRIAGATAFWNVEGVALGVRRPGFHSFRVDEYGAPSYPELVLCATRRTVERRLDLIRSVVRAIQRGYRFTVGDPEGSIDDLLRSQPALDRDLTRRQLAAVDAAFRAPDGRYGELDPVRLRAWAAWDLRFGIVHRAPDIARAFAARVPTT